MGAGHCEAYVDNATGAVHSYGDSKEMCGVAAGAIELGIIAQPTRLARTLLIDVGAAWSGEVIVGHKMGFQVAAFEARESEYKNIVRATRRFPGVDVGSRQIGLLADFWPPGWLPPGKGRQA